MYNKKHLLVLPVTVLMILTAGCKDTGITESPDTQELSEQSNVDNKIMERANALGFSSISDLKPGFYPDRDPMPQTAELMRKLREQRQGKKKALDSKALPGEIVHAHKQLQQDLKAFYGVEELPKTEIAPGVTIAMPESYMKGDKFNELNDFLSKRNRGLKELYEKNGLREIKEVRRSKAGSGNTPEISQTLGYGGSFVTAYRPGPSTATGNYYSYTEAYSIPYYLDVISEYYAGGFYLGQATDRNYNTPFVELSLGPVDVQGSYVCYDISSDHYIVSQSMQPENFFSADSDCI